jgi:hypothetical protein
LDFFGGGYVELAVTELGIAPQRLDTVIDFPALERFGVMFVGNQDAAVAAGADRARRTDRRRRILSLIISGASTWRSEISIAHG